MKITNRIVSIFIFVINIYFLPFSFIQIRTFCQTNIFELIIPISISVNMLLLTAILTFKKRYNKNKWLLFTNIFGMLWALFWLYLLITIPIMD